MTIPEKSNTYFNLFLFVILNISSGFPFLTVPFCEINSYILAANKNV